MYQHKRKVQIEIIIDNTKKCLPTKCKVLIRAAVDVLVCDLFGGRSRHLARCLTGQHHAVHLACLSSPGGETSQYELTYLTQNVSYMDTQVMKLDVPSGKRES